MSMAKPEAFSTHLVVQIAMNSPSGNVERTVKFHGPQAREIFSLLFALLDQLNPTQGKGEAP